MAINIFVTLHIFPSNRAIVLAKVPEIFHANKLGKCVQHSGVLQGYKYILFGQMSVILQNTTILYSRVRVFKPNF